MYWEFGDQVAQYRIVRLLGTGGMSAVYLAEDTRLKRLVAVKFLSEAYTYDATTRQRFLQEARAAASMDHPNIAMIHDLQAHGEQTFIVMPYYQGRGLDDILKEKADQQSHVRLDEALDYVAQTAAGLAEAHINQIVHRDIKPSNLFVTLEGTVKILDFGVAQMADAELRMTAGNMIGTPAYMPPEQVRGKPVQQQADVWSLGVVLYELLTGLNPFRSANGLAATLLKVVKEDPPEISHYRLGLPLGFDPILRRALAKKPEERYPSCDALLDELQAVDMSMITQERSGQALGTAWGKRLMPASQQVVPATSDTSPQAIPGNVPKRLGKLFGREDELALIDLNLSDPDCRILTLLAQGGTGKTYLSLAAAKAAVDTERFSGGVYFVPLEQLSRPNQIASSLAEVLGLNLQAGLRPLDQLIDGIADAPMLLVLDNFEHLVAGGEQLAELARACVNLKMLVTSRERLNLAEEWTLPLAGLSYPGNDDLDVSLTRVTNYAAVQLFEARAKRSKFNFKLEPQDVPAVMQISRLVHGLPLGLELAAAWVTTLSCAEIASEISRSYDFLDSRSRNKVGRHQSIRAVFEHSWQLLSHNEQQHMAHVAIFEGGFDAPAAQTIAGVDEPTLARAVDKSLLQRNHQRYRFHPLLLQYVAEKLAESGQQDSLEAAHGNYYMRNLEQWRGKVLSRGQEAMLDALNKDLKNHYRAWEWARDHDPARLSQATDPMMFVHSLQGRLSEGQHLFGDTVQALTTQLEPPSAASQQGATGLTDPAVQAAQPEAAQPEAAPKRTRRNPRKQLASLFAALDGEDASPDSPDDGSSNANTPDAQNPDVQNPPQSTTLTPLSANQRAKLQVALAYSKQAFAWFEEHIGEGQVALEHCSEALFMFREQAQAFGTMRALTLLADMNLRQGKLDVAERLLSEALELAEPFGAGESSMLLNKLGDLYLAQQSLNTAERYYDRSVSASNNDTSDVSPMINVNNFRGLGRIALHRHEWQAARIYFEKSLELSKTMQFRLREPYILTNLARVLAHPENVEQDLPKAWQLLKDAVAIASKRGQQGSLAETYAVMGELASRPYAMSLGTDVQQQAHNYWLESLRAAWRQRDYSAALHALTALVALPQDNDDSAGMAAFTETNFAQTDADTPSDTTLNTSANTVTDLALDTAFEDTFIQAQPLRSAASPANSPQADQQDNQHKHQTRRYTGRYAPVEGFHSTQTNITLQSAHYALTQHDNELTEADVDAWHNAIIELVVAHPASHSEDRARANELPKRAISADNGHSEAKTVPDASTMTVEDAVRYFLPNLPVQAPMP
ncbi:MAG: protein kinase [Deinococcota bacterium]